MQSTYLSRDFVKGVFNITVNAYRTGSTARWTIDVVTHRDGNRVSPVWRDYDRSYLNIESAQQAGLAGGMRMISGLNSPSVVLTH